MRTEWVHVFNQELTESSCCPLLPSTCALLRLLARMKRSFERREDCSHVASASLRDTKAPLRRFRIEILLILKCNVVNGNQFKKKINQYLNELLMTWNLYRPLSKVLTFDKVGQNYLSACSRERVTWTQVCCWTQAYWVRTARAKKILRLVVENLRAVKWSVTIIFPQAAMSCENCD